MLEIDRVQEILAYEFRNPEWAKEALTHSSYSNEDRKLNPAVPPLSDNERLEFLGDAVIGLAAAQLLMEAFPTASEGKLSRWRSCLVSRRNLAEIAVQLGLGETMLLGQGERRTGGAEKRSILAATLEAIVGAIYLDGQMEGVWPFLRRIYAPVLANLAENQDAPVPSQDNKTYLQEVTQSLYKSTPLYKLVNAWGPEHDKVFRVEIHVDGQLVGTGDGRSKKDAEQEAARIALNWIDGQRGGEKQ